jgi:hypothetical protein
LVSALTWTWEGRVALRVEDVLARVRRTTPSHFVDSVDAARVGDGLVTDATVNRKIAANRAARMRTGDVT